MEEVKQSDNDSESKREWCEKAIEQLSASMDVLEKCIDSDRKLLEEQQLLLDGCKRQLQQLKRTEYL